MHTKRFTSDSEKSTSPIPFSKGEAVNASLLSDSLFSMADTSGSLILGPSAAPHPLQLLALFLFLYPHDSQIKLFTALCNQSRVYCLTYAEYQIAT